VKVAKQLEIYGLDGARRRAIAEGNKHRDTPEWKKGVGARLQGIGGSSVIDVWRASRSAGRHLLD
jgi:hypothetical protein